MGPVSTFCLLFIVSEIGTGFPIGALRGSGHPQWQALESCSNATICNFDGLSPPRSTRRRAPERRAARPCHDGSARSPAGQSPGMRYRYQFPRRLQPRGPSLPANLPLRPPPADDSFTAARSRAKSCGMMGCSTRDWRFRAQIRPRASVHQKQLDPLAQPCHHQRYTSGHVHLPPLPAEGEAMIRAVLHHGNRHPFVPRIANPYPPARCPSA